MALNSLQQLEELLLSGFITDTEFIRRKLEIQEDFIHKLFSYFDHDHDNSISFAEFQNLVYEVGEMMTEAQVRDCYSQLDLKNTGFFRKRRFF